MEASGAASFRFPCWDSSWRSRNWSREPVAELEEPVPEFPEPLLPVFELDKGAVGGDEPKLLPELPVVVDVVAALATSAPPARSPEVRAPTASTLRGRICMVALPFVSWDAGPFGPVPQTMRPQI